MDAKGKDSKDLSSIAAAMGEPGRARMLCCLLDGRARTATELAVVAGIAPPTASAHLTRLRNVNLVKVVHQGKHRYYTLDGPEVAAALEGLMVISNQSTTEFKPNTPNELCVARTCYDHIAGHLGVVLHDQMVRLKWLVLDGADYVLTPKGHKALIALGVDESSLTKSRRRFAYPCLDWSERCPHLGGSVGAAILTMAKAKRWVSPVMESRALTITALGRREFIRCFEVLEDSFDR